jgi:hypothetical protein
MLWVAMKGASKYRAAVAAGDVADSATQIIRVATCGACPSITWDNSAMVNVRRGWCGEPFKETDTTCGCLVALTVFGDGLQAAGRVCVKSLSCPQEKW